MKNIILICLLLVAFAVQSQNDIFGNITYKKILNVDKDFDGNISKEMLDRYLEMKKSMDVLTYNLAFNTDNAVFNINKTMAADYQKMTKKAISKGFGDGIHYVNLKDNKHIHSKMFDGKEYHIFRKNKLQFELTNEQKKIGGYICFKAVAQETVHYFGSSNEVYYTAWYCPEIPYNYGPALFYGLPGLVLEADILNTKYIATNINIIKECIEIQQPKKGIEISNEDFDILLKKAFENKYNKRF